VIETLQVVQWCEPRVEVLEFAAFLLLHPHPLHAELSFEVQPRELPTEKDCALASEASKIVVL